MNKFIRLIKCILIPLLVGGISGYFTSTSITTWFVTLNKPSFNPPNYLFGPVWTLLYVLMGVSIYIALNKSKPENKNGIIFVFAFQLILNFIWSFIFFKYHNLGLAFIEIIIMWFSISYMIFVFYKTSKIAALINIPYLVWVSFASVLNGAIWYLN